MVQVSIIGVGHTRFGRLPERSVDLMRSAITEALSDADVSPERIDAVWVANFSDAFDGQCHLAAVAASLLGRCIQAQRVESACASGGLAFKEAARAVESGRFRTVLVVGVEKMASASPGLAVRLLAGAASPDEIAQGASFPGLYAMIARAHFERFGTTSEQLAHIAVKNHEHALMNPLAQFAKPLSVEDVLKSRPVASPLHLLDCSPLSDGAAALVLSAESTAQAPRVLGLGHVAAEISLAARADICTMDAVKEAGALAYSEAGIGPGDIDVAELHDCFTIAELVQFEDLGFCAKGEGGPRLASGSNRLGGDLPINASGGLKAKGHPVGATGVSQVVEVVRQLRGCCGQRQVESADMALCCNIGGSGSSAVVSILGR